jgi:MSHA pilin protein MshD
MTRSQQKGFTLVEMVIFIVVVGVGLSGVLLALNTSATSSAHPMVRKQAVVIAESLLEEIVQKEYAKPADSTVKGYSSGGSRATFDCVDDYQGYTTAGGVLDVNGATISGLSSYNITPAVAVSTTTLSGRRVKQVVVSVTGPLGVVSLTGYRGSY